MAVVIAAYRDRAGGFAALNDDGTAQPLDLAKVPTGGTRALTADEQALVTAELAKNAVTAQDASIALLLSQATTLIASLDSRRAAIVTANGTLTTARNAKTSAQSTYLGLGTPTLAQVDTFLTAYIPYVTALDAAIVQNGTDAVADIDDLKAVVRRLANFVARYTGSTTVINGG